MNLAFWFCAALVVALAVSVVVIPLLRSGRTGGVAAQTALLREQLDALKSAHAAGLVSAADFESRKQQLSEAALAMIDAPGAAARTPRAAIWTAAVVVLLVPLLTMLIYQRIGMPAGVNVVGPGPGSAAAGAMPTDANGAPDLVKAAETLAAKLAANPNDGEGWVLLGRTYRAIERFADARTAFEKARALVPESADLLAESAEVIGLTSEPRSLKGEPETLVDRALTLDGNNQNALFLKGLARAQADDPEGAERHWEKLLGLMETGSSAQIAVIEQLNTVRARLGKEPMLVPQAVASTPTPPPAGAAGATPSGTASSAGIEVRVEIAPELAGKVEASDVLFIFARAESGPPMPLAIQRLAATQLPVTVKLDESMGMMAGMSLANFDKVVIGARVSKSGNAQGQPGDLETLSAPVEWRTAGSVALTIDKVR